MGSVNSSIKEKKGDWRTRYSERRSLNRWLLIALLALAFGAMLFALWPNVKGGF